MRPTTLFHETQAISQRRTRIILALPPAALVFVSVRQIALHHPWGNPPMSNGGLLFLTILLVLVYIRLNTVKLATDVDRDKLTVGLQGLWRRRRVPLAAIRSAVATTYDPIAEYGGAGIRSGPRGLGYIAKGTRGVQVELTNGDKLLISSQRAEELASAIMTVKDSRD